MVVNLLKLLARNTRKRRRLKFAADRIWLAARKGRQDRNRNENGTEQTKLSTNQKGTLETCFSTCRNLACTDGTSGSAFGSSPASTSPNGFLSAGNGSRPRRNRRRSIYTTVRPTALATPPAKQLYPTQHPPLTTSTYPGHLPRPFNWKSSNISSLDRGESTWPRDHNGLWPSQQP